MIFLRSKIKFLLVTLAILSPLAISSIAAPNCLTENVTGAGLLPHE
ncbi:MAG: hypothetical protein ACR2JY_14535 [Chloroflexota bacterium]